MKYPLIRYQEGIPSEVLPTIQRLVEPWRWLIPPWCQEVKVVWEQEAAEGDAAGASACAYVNYEYRWARISFYPRFLTDPPHLQTENVAHELLHIAVEPLARYALETVDTLLKEESPKFHATLRKELTERTEAVVTDLAYLINSRMPETPSATDTTPG